MRWRLRQTSSGSSWPLGSHSSRPETKRPTAEPDISLLRIRCIPELSPTATTGTALALRRGDRRVRAPVERYLGRSGRVGSDQAECRRWRPGEPQDEQRTGPPGEQERHGREPERPHGKAAAAAARDVGWSNGFHTFTRAGEHRPGPPTPATAERGRSRARRRSRRTRPSALGEAAAGLLAEDHRAACACPPAASHGDLVDVLAHEHGRASSA